jgi:hypothetical protein
MGIGQGKGRTVNSAGRNCLLSGNKAKQRERELNKGIGEGKGKTVNSAGRDCQLSRENSKAQGKGTG